MWGRHKLRILNSPWTIENYHKLVFVKKKNKVCILLFSVLSNSVAAWQSLKISFYKIVVTCPVVSVNIVKISSIFKKLYVPISPIPTSFLKRFVCVSTLPYCYWDCSTKLTKSLSIFLPSLHHWPPFIKYLFSLASGRYHLQVCFLSLLCRHLFPLNICVLGIFKFGFKLSYSPSSP